MILYEIPKHIRIFRIQRMNHVFHIDESEARFRAYISQQQSTPGRAQNPPSDDQAQQAQHAPFQTAQSDKFINKYGVPDMLTAAANLEASPYRQR